MHSKWKSVLIFYSKNVIQSQPQQLRDTTHISVNL